MRKTIFLFVALILLISCRFRLSFNPEDGFEGHWHTDFSAIYIGIMIPETDSVLTINHTSDMYFEHGSYDIFIDPPVPPLLGGMGEYNAYWTGNYRIMHDTLILADDSKHGETERYSFRISGDTLSLSYIPRVVEQQDDKLITEMPIYGGLPWGGAFMWHAGNFYRSADQDSG